MYKRTSFKQRNFSSAHQPDKILFSSLNLIVICCLYSSILNFVYRMLVLLIKSKGNLNGQKDYQTYNIMAFTNIKWSMNFHDAHGDCKICKKVLSSSR